MERDDFRRDCRHYYGAIPTGETCNNNGQGLPLLNGPTEFGDRNPLPTQFTIDPKKIAEAGDLLFCVRGSTTGRMNWADQKYAIGRGIASIRAKDGILFQPYIRAIIEKELKSLLAVATGSTFPNISKDHLLNLIVQLPSKNIKIYISNLARILDEKIYNLRSQNETLEAIAQTLFKHWFIDFEFPNADGKPYKSSGGAMVRSALGYIPEAWSVGKLGQYLNIKHGYAFKGEYITTEVTEKILLTPVNFKIGGGFNDSKYKYYSADDYSNEYVLRRKDLAITMTDLSKEGDSLGYPAFIPDIKGKVFLHNQRIGKVENNNIDKTFLYFLLCRREYRSHILGTSSGSTVRHTSPSRICEYSFVIPDFELIDKFSALATATIDKILISTL